MDFDKFIEYLSEREITIGKKTGFISPKFLFEINSLMSIKQEDVNLRSTELSYPLLHLFCVLVKSSRLFIQNSGKSGKSVLKASEYIKKFKDLNVTEKYISLLEILWMDCDFEKLQYQTYDSMNSRRVAVVLSYIVNQESGKKFNLDEFITYNSSSIILYFYYFGILNYKEYEKAESGEKGRFFEPDEISINPFGMEIIKILNKERNIEVWNIPYRREIGEWNINFEDLHNSIHEAFGFDNDHMYSFFMDGEAWSNNRLTCPYDERGPYVNEVKIGELDLYEKQEFLYLFDFGDEWRFNVKVF